MTLPYHSKDEKRPVPVVYASVPPDEEPEEETAHPGYEHFATITLQGTLYSLRQAVKVHGETERTRAIELGIMAELERREETA